jgi:PKD repeat protein
MAPGTGNYTVTLTVYDNVGVPGTATVRIEVLNREPVAKIGPLMYVNGELRYVYARSVTLLEDDELLLPSNNSYDPDGLPDDLTVRWVVDGPEGWSVKSGGDGELMVSSSVQGNLTVGLNVTDAFGSDDYSTITVIVLNKAPVASFRLADVDYGKIRFDASASRDTPSDNETLHYRWDFGDGDTAEGPGPRHTYTSTGDFTVTLVVTDDDGATSNVSMNITIEELVPDNTLRYVGVAMAAVGMIIIALAAWRLKGKLGKKEDEEKVVDEEKGNEVGKKDVGERRGKKDEEKRERKKGRGGEEGEREGQRKKTKRPEERKARGDGPKKKASEGRKGRSPGADD